MLAHTGHTGHTGTLGHGGHGQYEFLLTMDMWHELGVGDVTFAVGGLGQGAAAWAGVEGGRASPPSRCRAAEL